jgi:hypothetical protein
LLNRHFPPEKLRFKRQDVLHYGPFDYSIKKLR